MSASKASGASGEFDAQTAIVTGAAGGLGRIVAGLIAGRGGHVVLLDIDAAGLERIGEPIAETGGSSESHVVDVTDERGVTSFADGFSRRRSDLHILVNNAGGWNNSELLSMEKADWAGYSTERAQRAERHAGVYDHDGRMALRPYRQRLLSQCL